MIQAIQASVAAKLSSSFSAVTVYTEEVNLTTPKPCFVVTVPITNQTRLSGERRSLDTLVLVQYHPKPEGESHKSINDVIPVLYEQLETLSLSGTLVNGGSMATEIKTGILHFQVKYQLIINRETEADEAMEGIVIQN